MTTMKKVFLFYQDQTKPCGMYNSWAEANRDFGPLLAEEHSLREIRNPIKRAYWSFIFGLGKYLG